MNFTLTILWVSAELNTTLLLGGSVINFVRVTKCPLIFRTQATVYVVVITISSFSFCLLFITMHVLFLNIKSTYLENALVNKTTN